MDLLKFDKINIFLCKICIFYLSITYYSCLVNMKKTEEKDEYKDNYLLYYCIRKTFFMTHLFT